jgi:hypothetical protein
MAPDLDGYGDEQLDPIERLLEDIRTLSRVGIERMAWGWDRREAGPGLQRFHAAERAALQLLEEQGRAPGWEDLRRRVLDLTEGRSSLVAWRAEHGEAGHKAESATLAAALALLAGSDLAEEHRHALLAAAAEALPWLLPDVPPDPYDEPRASAEAP